METTNRSDQIWQSTEIARGYLEGMRGAIPLASEQLAIMIRVIRVAHPELQTFLDIGWGDGILSNTILAHYPDAQGLLLDFSPAMIEAARHKLASNRTQLQFITEDYSKPDWVEKATAISPYDAVVTGFSIHHQPNLRKRVYIKRYMVCLNREESS